MVTSVVPSTAFEIAPSQVLNTADPRQPDVWSEHSWIDGKVIPSLTPISLVHLTRSGAILDVKAQGSDLDKSIFIATSFQDSSLSIEISVIVRDGPSLLMKQVNVFGPQGDLVASSDGQQSLSKQLSFQGSKGQPYAIEVIGESYSLRNIYLLSANLALSEPEIAWFQGRYQDSQLEFLDVLERAYSKMIELRGMETDSGGVTLNLLPWPAAWAGKAAFAHGFMGEGETQPDYWEFVLKNRVYLPGSTAYYEKTGYLVGARIVLDRFFHEIAHCLFEPVPTYLEEGFACFFEIETFALLDYRNEYVEKYSLTAVMLFEQNVGNDYGRIASYVKGAAFQGAWIAAYVLHDFVGHEQWLADAVRAKFNLTPRDLVQNFGWDFYKRYFGLVRTKQPPAGYTDDANFAYYFGQAAGQDLTGLFESWGFVLQTFAFTVGTPSSQSSSQGGSATFSFTVTTTSGTPQSVTLNLLNQPPGTTLSWSENPVTPITSGTPVELTIQTSCTTAAQTYGNLQTSGSGGGTSASSGAFSLVVSSSSTCESFSCYAPSAIPSSGAVPLTVQFSTSCSGGAEPYSYSWLFGDGDTSILQNPSHTYSNAGTYSWSVAVIDSGSKRYDASGAVVVDRIPTSLTISFSPTTVDPPRGEYTTITVLLNPSSSGRSIRLYSAPSLAGPWTLLDTCSTDENGACAKQWFPPSPDSTYPAYYYLAAEWDGDSQYGSARSDTAALSPPHVTVIPEFQSPALVVLLGALAALMLLTRKPPRTYGR